MLMPRRWTRTSSSRAITSAVHQEFRHELEALTRAGWSLGFTCHAQNIERVNADGLNTLVCDMKLTYVSGKLGKWDIAPLWRDWADHCVYLDLEGGKFSKLDKEKIAWRQRQLHRRASRLPAW